MALKAFIKPEKSCRSAIFVETLLNLGRDRADKVGMENNDYNSKQFGGGKTLYLLESYLPPAQAGFTIVEFLIGISVSSILLAAAASAFAMFAESAQSVKTNQSLIQFKGQIVREILNPASLMATIADSSNTSMLCLKQGTDCSGVTKASLRLNDSHGKLLFDSISASSGLDQNGALCSGFSQASPNGACPYRYELTWKPLCSSTPCINPPIQISGIFKSSLEATDPKNTVSKNYARLNFQLATDLKAGSPFAPSKVYYVNYNATSTLPILASASPGQYGGTMTATILVPPSHGTASISGGSLVLIPTAGYHGLDSVSYRVTNSSGKSADATASLKIMTPYTWTGDAADSVWSTAGNWCRTVKADFSGCVDGIVPDSSSVAIFDATCSGNCDANMTSAVTIWGMIMDTGYNGTVSQVTGDWTVGSAGFVIRSGKLAADSNYNTTFNGPFNYNGGVFETWSATYTGTLTLNGDVNITNWALLTMRPTVLTNTGVSTTVNGIIYAMGYCDFTVAGTDTITLNGNITTGGTAKFNKTGGDLIGGYILFYGDAVIESLPGTHGTTRFSLSGSVGHTITGVSGNIPNLYVVSWFSIFPPPWNTQTLIGNIHVLHTATIYALNSPIQGQDSSTTVTVDEVLDLHGSTYTKNGSTLIVGGVVQGTGSMDNGNVAP